MPRDSTHALQLSIFIRDTVEYPEAFARYEAIRPMHKGEQNGINHWRLWRALRRFRCDGLLGLINRWTLPHTRGKSGAKVFLPRHIRQHVVQLAMAHPFTARELVRIVRDGYHYRLRPHIFSRSVASPGQLEVLSISV